MVVSQNDANLDLCNCLSSCNAIESGKEMKLEDMGEKLSKTFWGCLFKARAL